MSDAEQRFFAEHGYLIVRGAIAPERVTALEAALDSVRATLPEAQPGLIWESAGLSRAHPALREQPSSSAGSEHVRKTLVTRLFDATCTLLADRLPDGALEHFPTRDGERLDPAAFPVVFSRPRSGSPRST